MEMLICGYLLFKTKFDRQNDLFAYKPYAVLFQHIILILSFRLSVFHHETIPLCLQFATVILSHCARQVFSATA